MTLLTNNIRSQNAEAVRDTAVHTTDALTATDVVFYLLGKKFVEDKTDIPKEARDVIYYTLSMGHNTGIIDCFEPKLALDRATFDKICDSLSEGDAKFKLTRIEKFGEIQIMKEDTNMLVEAMKQASFNDGFSFSKPSSDDRYKDVRVGNIDEFRAAFIKLMNDIKCEPQVYCLARRVTTR